MLRISQDFGYPNAIFPATAEIQFPRWGGGGGGAKLHEFPTLHRSARLRLHTALRKPL